MKSNFHFSTGKPLYLPLLSFTMLLISGSLFAGDCGDNHFWRGRSSADRIWRSDVTLGLVMAQARNDLSRPKLLLKFEGNSLLKKTGPTRLHSFLSVGMTRAPQQFVFRNSAGGPAVQNFIETDKTLQTDLGLYWTRGFRPSEGEVLELGPVFHFGTESVLGSDKTLLIDNARYTLDRKNQYSVGGGLLFTRHRASAESKDLNPRILQSVELLFSRRSQFQVESITGLGAVEARSMGRMSLNAYSRMTSGIYIGFSADFPLDFEVSGIQGEPNLGLWIGVKL